MALVPSQLHYDVILNQNVVEVKNLPTHVGETLRFAQDKLRDSASGGRCCGGSPIRRHFAPIRSRLAQHDIFEAMITSEAD